MSSIPQTKESEQQLEGTINKFISAYKIRQLLISCNAGKEKGIPIMKVFRYLLCIVFADRSMYMQLKTDAFRENFSKNTIYRFLDNPKTNWKKFTALLLERIINGFFRRLTSDERSDVFIIDDTFFDRSSSKKTDMLAKVFDHCSMRYKKGFTSIKNQLGLDTISEFFHITEEQLAEFTSSFINRLPKYMKDSLNYTIAA